MYVNLPTFYWEKFSIFLIKLRVCQIDFVCQVYIIYKFCFSRSWRDQICRVLCIPHILHVVKQRFSSIKMVYLYLHFKIFLSTYFTIIWTYIVFIHRKCLPYLQPVPDNAVSQPHQDKADAQLLLFWATHKNKMSKSKNLWHQTILFYVLEASLISCFWFPSILISHFATLFHFKWLNGALNKI